MESTPLTNKKKSVSKKKNSTQSVKGKKGQPKQIPDNLKAQSQTPPVPEGGKVVNPFSVVAIGASAGGLEAITQLLRNLSPNTGMAYIYVQHLSPDHKSLLTPILSKVTQMTVQDIEDMEKILPDNVYVIPYNKEIEVIDGHIQLIPRPPNKSANLSIDVLFSSLAETHKENVIGIVLSGSASDGTRGLKEIKQSGGITFAQDDSAKFSSMPQSAIAAGVVDFVLSPKDIAAELNWMSKHQLTRRNPVKTSREDEIGNNDPDLKIILQLLYKRKNIDFSHYKMNTIKRRMLRRMLIHKIKSLNQYADLLGQKKDEVELLYLDLLINVSDFFRDTDAFLLLKKTILPRLLKRKTQGETLRIWVAACSTGEEVYSIAMSLLEIQANKANQIPFQIFATDISAEAVIEARIGEYSEQRLKNVSPKRLQQFFTKSKDKYRITKSLRDVCVFAQHNILRDPPFSHMDLISCRNMLIYLDAAAQKKAIATFHYALNEGGCLLLGKSETIGTSSQLFTAINKKYKIYSRKKNSGVLTIPVITPTFSHQPSDPFYKKENTITISKKTTAETDRNLGSVFESFLLSRYIPASVVINHNMEILEFRGPTEMYLKNPSGKASFNILKMAYTEIAFELRNAIHHAFKTKQPVRKTGIEMNRDTIGNTVQIVTIEAVPLKIEGEEPMLVIVFTRQQQTELIEQQSMQGEKHNSGFKDRRIKKLEEELAAVHSDMNSITHDQEAANEELQSANEEIVSSNEELQSLNEELETSKEEIESANEELTTSNQELQARSQQVEELYTYYEAILSTFQEPMLILDKDMRIKSANKSFYRIFRVTEEESIGISLFKLGNNQWEIPRLRELLEEILPNNNRFQDFEVEHTFPVIGHKTMLLNAHRIFQQRHNEDLIVLTIIDITEVRRLAIEIQTKEKEALVKQLKVEQKALKKIEENNIELLEAKRNEEQKRQLAENAVQAKQRFLSNMSHEIRTPMNSIIGFSNLLLKSNLDETQKSYLNAIKMSGDALVVLINDILDLAKVDAGKMTFEQLPFNLSDAICTILQLFEPNIREKNLELLVEFDNSIPQILVGDAMRLRQIILNLFSNALKFTTEGKISVSVRMLKEDSKKATIEFTLTDTGIGIEEDKLAIIFNDFEQASAEINRIFGGTGLGLAIVKKMVEHQGGTLIVKSKVGVGSTFGFVLSFEKAEIETGTKTEIETDKETDTVLINSKILVAEDVVLNQLLIKVVLEDFGFDVDVAGNGEIAIEYLKKNKYDLILMDLHMPVMNGFEATAYIRNQMNLNIPIIALTADVTTMDVKKGKVVGLNDYISKPIDEKLLYSKIIYCLKNMDQNES
jgi:two-component system CheB/CheR fusion protein